MTSNLQINGNSFDTMTEVYNSPETFVAENAGLNTQDVKSTMDGPVENFQETSQSLSNKNLEMNSVENNVTLPNASVESRRSIPNDTLTRAQIKELVSKNVEHFFSRENWGNDQYLLSQMDSDRYVPVYILANCIQFKTITKDHSIILEALKDSMYVQLDEEKNRVRPNYKRCIVCLREIPEDTPVNEIEAMFGVEGCPKSLSCECVGNNFWYITFESDEDAQKAYLYLRNTVKTFKDRPIFARMKTKPVSRYGCLSVLPSYSGKINGDVLDGPRPQLRENPAPGVLNPNMQGVQASPFSPNGMQRPFCPPQNVNPQYSNYNYNGTNQMPTAVFYPNLNMGWPTPNVYDLNSFMQYNNLSHRATFKPPTGIKFPNHNGVVNGNNGNNKRVSRIGNVKTDKIDGSKPILSVANMPIRPQNGVPMQYGPGKYVHPVNGPHIAQAQYMGQFPNRNESQNNSNRSTPIPISSMTSELSSSAKSFEYKPPSHINDVPPLVNPKDNDNNKSYMQEYDPSHGMPLLIQTDSNNMYNSSSMSMPPKSADEKVYSLPPGVPPQAPQHVTRVPMSKPQSQSPRRGPGPTPLIPQQESDSEQIPTQMTSNAAPLSSSNVSNTAQSISNNNAIVSHRNHPNVELPYESQPQRNIARGGGRRRVGGQGRRDEDVNTTNNTSSNASVARQQGRNAPDNFSKANQPTEEKKPLFELKANLFPPLPSENDKEKISDDGLSQTTWANETQKFSDIMKGAPKAGKAGSIAESSEGEGSCISSSSPHGEIKDSLPKPKDSSPKSRDRQGSMGQEDFKNETLDKEIEHSLPTSQTLHGHNKESSRSELQVSQQNRHDNKVEHRNYEKPAVDYYRNQDKPSADHKNYEKPITDNRNHEKLVVEVKYYHDKPEVDHKCNEKVDVDHRNEKLAVDHHRNYDRHGQDYKNHERSGHDHKDHERPGHDYKNYDHKNQAVDHKNYDHKNQAVDHKNYEKSGQEQRPLREERKSNADFQQGNNNNNRRNNNREYTSNYNSRGSGGGFRRDRDSGGGGARGSFNKENRIHNNNNNNNASSQNRSWRDDHNRDSDGWITKTSKETRSQRENKLHNNRDNRNYAFKQQQQPMVNGDANCNNIRSSSSVDYEKQHASDTKQAHNACSEDVPDSPHFFNSTDAKEKIEKDNDKQANAGEHKPSWAQIAMASKDKMECLSVELKEKEEQERLKKRSNKMPPPRFTERPPPARENRDRDGGPNSAPKFRDRRDGPTHPRDRPERDSDRNNRNAPVNEQKSEKGGRNFSKNGANQSQMAPNKTQNSSILAQTINNNANATKVL